MYFSVPTLIWGVICTNAFTLYIAWLTFKRNEYSKQKERETTERYKQIDIQQKQTDLEIGEINRRIDLYKVVFPKQLAAVEPLASSASDLATLISVYGSTGRIDYISKETPQELWKDIVSLNKNARAAQWLLDGQIIEAITNLTNICTQIMNMTEDKDWKERGMAIDNLNTSYAALVNTLREQVHLTDIQPTFRLPVIPDDLPARIEQKREQ